MQESILKFQYLHLPKIHFENKKLLDISWALKRTECFNTVKIRDNPRKL